MSSQATDYHTNAASFALPARLKDKSMHMFTLEDDGPSEFSMVMSHADADAGEEVDDFANRLLKELDKALPKFQLRGMSKRALDGSPAVELAYSWRNDGIFMHQRQVIALMQGTSEGKVQALMVAATCPKGFTDEWNAAFDQVLDSMKLRRPLAGQGEAPAAAVECVFALSERRRTLYVFADRDEACRKIDAREVEQDAWAFFDGDGRPLAADFVVPNSGTLFRKSGSYVLADAPGVAPLADSLGRAAVLQSSVDGLPFSSIEQVQDHLRRRAGPGGTSASARAL